MVLYLKQQSSEWGKMFVVFDENNKEHYKVKFDPVSIGKRMHLLDANGKEVLFLKQKPFSPITIFELFRDGKKGEKIGEITKGTEGYDQKYTVTGFDCEVKGEFYTPEYKITHDGLCLAEITRKWFKTGESVQIDIQTNFDEAWIVSIVLVVSECTYRN